MESFFQIGLEALLDALTGMGLVLGPPLVAALILQLVARSLQRRMIDLIGLGPFIALTAPGIVIHELSHAFFCLLFAHRIERIALFQPDTDGTLGFVEHRYNRANPWAQLGNFFIGTGPVWIGSTVLLLSLWLLTDGRISTDPDEIRDLLLDIDWGGYRVYVVLYLFISVGSHVRLSLSDLQGALTGFVWIFALWIAVSVVDRFAWNLLPPVLSRAESLSWIVAAMLGFVIAVLLALTLPLALFNRLNKRTSYH